jgi:site-specific DNA-methyltransferase (adenine-specific)
MINITNECNMKLMARYPDNHFDLAIVDPPYGIDVKTRVFDDGKKWDSEIPTKEYFNQLFRVSKNQIIWGANHFLEYLNNTKSFIVWDKLNTDRSKKWTCELAWSSFNDNSYITKAERPGEHGFYVVDCKRIHPTQKPVKLYEWLLMNYAKEGDKILDTHLGSGSIALACHNLKYNLTGCELDKEYYDEAMLRLKQHQQQLTMF